MHPYVNTAVRAARKAGDIIAHAYSRLDLVKVTKKGKNEFVTNIDKKAEYEIINLLRTAYPSHGFLGEESGSQKGDDYQWIIDPIDGTTNFIQGIPHFCISIALSFKNRIEHGVIYDPIRDEIFTASRGAGAQLNNHKIRVGNKRTIEECLLGIGFPYHSPEFHDSYYELVKNISKKTIGLRRMGSAALDLAYVASGRLDGFFEVGLSIWDIAAGVLIIKEAGGLVSDIEGGENYWKNGRIVTGNPKIFKPLLKEVSAYLKPNYDKQG